MREKHVPSFLNQGLNESNIYTTKTTEDWNLQIRLQVRPETHRHPLRQISQILRQVFPLLRTIYYLKSPIQGQIAWKFQGQQSTSWLIY